MNSKWIKMYLDIAKRIAEESHAVRLHVGAVFVSAEGVMSIGINGHPGGYDNTCEDIVFMDSDAGGWLDTSEIEFQWPFIDNSGKRYTLKTKDTVSHAEENLFAKLMRQGVSTIGGTLFLTHAPCIHCAKIIVNSGIRDVHYIDVYRLTDGLDWLIANGLNVTQWNRDYN